MDDNQFEELLRDLPECFNPPPAAPLDEMWVTIEAAHFDKTRFANRAQRFTPWLVAAATLLIGIAIGRYAPSRTPASAPAASTQRSAIASTQTVATDTSVVPDVYRDQTNRYLGQAAALLISLPAKSTNTKTDSAFAGKAADLLVTTRLLLDSPAAQDAKLHSLLEDLELVLVQIARLKTERNHSDLDLIHQAVEQGDVLSRLNSVAVTTQSEE